MLADKPKVFAKLFRKVIELFKEFILQPVSPLNHFPISRIEDAL
jgi:hypothetical protein